MTAQGGQRFRRRALRRGYKADEVDDFLERAEATVEGKPIGEPVTAKQVHDVVFRVRFGGYDEWQVDVYLDRLERQLTALEEQGGLPQPKRGSQRHEEPAFPHGGDRGFPQDWGMGNDFGEPPPDYGPGRRVRYEPDYDPELERPRAGMRSEPEDPRYGRLDEPPHGARPPAHPVPPSAGPPRPHPGQMPPPPMPMPPPGPPPVPPGRAPAPPPGRASAPPPGRPYSPAPGRPPMPEHGMPPMHEHGMPPMHEHGMPPMHEHGMPPMPEHGMPDRGMPDRGMPDRGMPDRGMPDRGMPPQHMPHMPGGYEPGRHGKLDMTSEIRSPDSPFTPEDMRRLEQLRRTFQIRRFGSGYDPNQVDRLFDAIGATMVGRSAVRVADGELDPGQFSLVPGGYFEAEVDAALREVRDLFVQRGVTR